MIGKVLNNRYRIDKEIGQGGMGTVYCGYDTSLERRVAIKVLSRSGLGTEGRRKLISEAQTAAKLNHPNIVTIYDVGEDDYSISIIFQLFSGLVELSPDLSVMPEIARNWGVLDDGCRYIFHLRDDVYWSDGVPVTAWDYKYAWLRVLDPLRIPILQAYSPISKAQEIITKVNSKTLIISVCEWSMILPWR